MRILIQAIIFVLIILTKIGDFILFLFLLMPKAIKLALLFTSKTKKRKTLYNRNNLTLIVKRNLQHLLKPLFYTLHVFKSMFFLILRLFKVSLYKIYLFIKLIFYLERSIETKLINVFLTIILSPIKLLSALRKIKIRKNKDELSQFLEYKHEHKKHKKRVSSPFPFIIKFKYFIFGFIFSSLFVFAPLLFIIFLQDLPSPKELVYRQAPQTTKIYDRSGKLLYQVYASQNRTIVPLTDIPKDLKNATIAIEDKDFYKHPGFDVSAIIRSAIKDLSGNKLQGGSTITQQLIKSALLTSETSMTRKVKEIILAFWSERIYTKNQLLEMYFNQVPYGGTAWGVEAASEVYFGKPVKNLDLAESAFLAGIPQAPTTYSPHGLTPNVWKNRQKEVLKRMTELGFITKQQAKKAEEQELEFKKPRMPIHAPHFVMYVKELLVQKYGLPMVEKGGLTVITSLDYGLQEDTQKIVTEEVNNNSFLNLTNGASLVTNPANGDVLAMVGSKDFYDERFGNVNLTTSLRQPGSSIKPVTYSAALSKGLTAASIIDDSPTSFPDGVNTYSPVNYDGKFHGRVTFRSALANSFNIPAVKLVNQIGVPEMVTLAKKMGITTWKQPNQYGLSITLGAAEARMTDMSTVYGTFANGGVKVDLNPFLKITDYKGNTLEEKSTPKNYSVAAPFDGVLASEKDHNKLFISSLGKRVLDEGVAFIISSILSDNAARAIEFGTNSPLNISGRTVSVKTGTSDNKRDNWTIGYTPNYVVAVWVGNNDNSPMSQNLASGITGAAPIWNKIMTRLLKDSPEIKPTQPLDVVQKNCMGRSEYFIKGTENSVNCNFVTTPTPSK